MKIELLMFRIYSKNKRTIPAEIPAITVSGAQDEPEPTPEGSSTSTTTECMGPPSVAGTSSSSTETPQPPAEQSEDMLEGEDGVTSEGEKAAAPPPDEGAEEEGREAEATTTPSTNTRTRSQTRGNGGGSGARRSSRAAHTPSRGMGRPGPTPIVWGEQRMTRHQQGSWGRRFYFWL